MITREDIYRLPSPCYLVDEEALVANLEVLAQVKKEGDCKILLALKSFAMWRLFDLIREYLDGVNAASPHEARLGLSEFKKEVHLCPAGLSEAEVKNLTEMKRAFPETPLILVFNSLSQWKRFGPVCQEHGIECGLRVNPERSVVKTPLYDPCRPGSRLGATAEELSACSPQELSGISGLHFHALCEQNAFALREVLVAFEEKFGQYLPGRRWVNFGGGHHITRLRRLHPDLGIQEDYDVSLLLRLIQDFKTRWPVTVYLEPGEAVVLGAGAFITTVVDVVLRDVEIAILDASAAAHMPDVIEMPYLPPALGATPAAESRESGKHLYRLAGNTCLAGDVIGEYFFPEPLRVGDRVAFLDQAHYTMVKNNTFNGVNLPALAVKRRDGRLEVLREFGYEDYKSRLS